MKKLFSGIFRWLAKRIEEEREVICQPEPQQAIEQESTSQPEIEEKQTISELKQDIILQQAELKVIEKESKSELETEDKTQIIEPKKKNKKTTEKNLRRKKPIEGEIVEVKIDPRDIRDMMEVMEYPYLSLSKNRTAPIHYERETSRGLVKIKVSCHSPHYIASIYDWDIIMFVESKMQEIINSKSDIPPRTFIVPRHELLKALHKQDGNKQKKDLKSSLTRLKTTVIETSVRNEDRKYDCFGWLDSWGYTERKDIKEIRITLSQWLYDGICRQGSLLKVRPEYFKITSGIKRFLYRIARKHVGVQNESWTLSVENLYEKSGSEREFKKFKHDLKKAVLDNDIPAYLMDWIENDGKTHIRFISRKKEIEKILLIDKDSRETQRE